MTRVMRIILFTLLLSAAAARADIAIVINSDSDVQQINRSEAINIFMGRYRKLPDGSVALPIDQTPLRARFYRSLVNKEMAEINSYWARLVFSGQSSPPQQAASTIELVDIITHNTNALGYIDSDQVPASMRVLMTLRE
ncbi:hypothetical protein SAMN05421848_1047 [Kushneria avicenniae]|uniref:Phosphate ABC transporter substrate-binding protein n=1 Tax=Kushneria avicenniae TaxID=402385 RepID=A0A1I1I8L7_9GAMM|nr:hypothetical protein [Kushneria avicenniae]SFC32112.1 hypothetical protein SAMN05421848_1047 [Kushneria avicenniae]